MRICIASTDIVGPVTNGGVGTAFTAVAEALAEAGHDVTILYCAQHYERMSREEVKDFYWGKKIRFTDLTYIPTPTPNFQPRYKNAPCPAIKAYAVYSWLSDKNFDVIHFPDYAGVGFFTAMAAQAGTAFDDTVICVTGHGPTMWSILTNDRAIDHPNLLLRDALERGMIAAADVLVTPNSYMYEWIVSNGWDVPDHHYMISGLLPEHSNLTELDFTRADEELGIDEVVFFGRVETRKGVWQFMDAIESLDRRGLMAGKKVAFLGKAAEDGRGISKRIIGMRAKKWSFDWRLEEELNTYEAMEYIARPGRLAVMPSTCDNSPYAVLEATTYGLPYITTAVGGVPELLHESCHGDVLVEPTARALEARIESAFAGRTLAATSHESLDLVRRKWIDFHECEVPRILAKKHSARQDVLVDKIPAVSVCLLHKDRPDYLAQALDSIKTQGYSNLEVILVDDWSQTSDALDYLSAIESDFDARGWKIVRLNTSHYPSGARNIAVNAASGEYVIFLDEDNLLKPGAIDCYVNAVSRTKLDVAVSLLDIFTSDTPPVSTDDVLRRQLFLGDAGVVGLFFNTMGDTNLVMRRADFLSVGGFDDVGYFAPVEDWRLICKLKKAGLKIGVIPDSLVWYRQEPNVWHTSWRKKNQDGAVRQAFDVLTRDMSYDEKLIAGFAQGMLLRALHYPN